MNRNLTLLSLALLLVSGAFAQSTGRITGSVVDASGAAVPGATVNLYMAGGSSPAATTVTTQEGIYRFAAVQPVTYDLSVEAKGFQKQVLRGIKVDAGLQLSVPPISVEVSTQTEVVEVAAEIQGVQTSNAEVASVITSEQVSRLPILNRNPMNLLTTQAGITYNSRTNTTINGMRPSFTNITVDGINIQDNFIRSNALDFQPNMLLMDQVAEMTVMTSNASAADGNGASQVKIVTPSGTNKLHGSAVWYNRNNIAAANTWFGNKNGTARPFLNQNQAGGSLGGPIVKDKLFFYGNYELLRLRQQSNVTRTILREDARNGIFSYLDTAGVERKANVLSAVGASADPVTRSIIAAIPNASFINRNDIGDGRNTGGYQFNARNNRTRDNITGKVDYVVNTKNVLTWSYLWNRDIVDRNDSGVANDFSVDPKVKNDGKVNFTSATWRWSPTAAFTNELRGGFNTAPALFLTSENFGSRIITVPTIISNPLNTFRAQGRYTDTYNLQNNANYFRGKHSFAFGFQMQKINTDPFNDAGNLPGYTLGISTANPNSISAANMPGLRSTDVTNANSLLALQAGYITSAAQTFNVTSIDSGFVPGASDARKYRLNNWAFYFNDTWRMNPRLTVNLGLRYEIYSRVTEANGLALLPRLEPTGVVDTLLNPNGVFDFAGSILNRPFYGKDMNNFGPNVGLAWQPFNDGGKTVIRAGFSTQFPNDEFIASVRNSVITNSGLAQGVSLTNLTSVTSNPTPIATPAFKVPRTYADNWALSPTAAVGMPDPNLRTPYVLQWNFGIQREIGGGVLEARYVGNRGVKQFRAFDYNQVLVRPDEFPEYYEDFNRAYQNGLRSLAANNVFDPRYNPAIAGSQQLPFFAQLPSGGLLTNGTVIGLIQRGELGGLADTYQSNRLNGPFTFFKNTNALGTNMMSNYSMSTYHALQMDYRRTFRSGLQMQVNYAFSKVLSDAAGDGQTRFEPFLDNRNAAIEKSRVPFDVTHALKFNGAYELPVGRGKALNVENAVLNQIVGGWRLAGFFTLQSGNPVSILAPRGTLNATRRSANNTAVTLLSGDALSNVVGYRMTPNGPYFVDPSAIGSDGRGVAPDGRAPFAGQAFYNPGIGTLGTLQRNYFTGPRFFNTDLSLAKAFQIMEGHKLEFRTEWFNFSNTPSFYIGTTDINSATFGRITDTASSRRVIQFGLYYKF